MSINRFSFGLLGILCCLPVFMQSAHGHPVDSIELQPLDHAQWTRQRQAYRGRILVVDMWATWCASCIERFPHMISLHQRYGPRGVQFVSLNLDDRGDHRSLQQAIHFLRSVNAHFPNYHMDENLMDAFDKLGLIGIPAVVIYDRSGKQAYRLTGDNPYHQFTDADIEQAIRQLSNE